MVSNMEYLKVKFLPNPHNIYYFAIDRVDETKKAWIVVKTVDYGTQTYYLKISEVYDDPEGTCWYVDSAVVCKDNMIMQYRNHDDCAQFKWNCEDFEVLGEITREEYDEYVKIAVAYGRIGKLAAQFGSLS